MTATLITIIRTDGAAHALSLDTSEMLSAIRVLLTGRSLMGSGDDFLTPANVAVEQSDEGTIALSDIVKNATVLIGEATNVSPIDPHDGVARYNALTDDQKNAIFANIQIFRGLTIGADGFGKTFNDVYSWKDGTLPAANMPTVLSEITSSYSFSKVTHDLAVFGSQSASVSLSSPYGSAEAEYKTESSQSSSSSEVTEYLVTRYVVRKVLLLASPSDFVVAPGFVSDVATALSGDQMTSANYFNLLDTLGKWGYYIPLQFTLGGVIYATDQTTISDFSEAESNKEEFNGSFKASFEGIGGGAAYGQASGSSTTTTTSTKFQNLELQLIGGQVGLEHDYTKWAASLDNAVDWELAETTSMYPTLALLAGTPQGNDLLGTAINVIENFSPIPTAAAAQPYISMQDYNTAVQSLLNPF
ncbi:MAG TPA: MAC/perforin domain-containing protein [Allosphingosinicella sp.]|jgi:hypothetical protein